MTTGQFTTDWIAIDVPIRDEAQSAEDRSQTRGTVVTGALLFFGPVQVTLFTAGIRLGERPTAIQ